MNGRVTVSPVDVQRARLLVRLNAALNEPTPAYVHKIAEAKPRAEQSLVDEHLLAREDPAQPVAQPVPPGLPVVPVA